MSVGSVSSSRASRASYSGPPAREAANTEVPSIRPASIAAANEAPRRRAPQPAEQAARRAAGSIRGREHGHRRRGDGGSSTDDRGGRVEALPPGGLHDGRCGRASPGRGSDPAGPARSAPAAARAPRPRAVPVRVIQSSFIGSSPRPGQARRCRVAMPSSRRSAAMARNWRPRTVPSWRPMASAASFADRPAKNRSSMASRCSGVSRRSANATLSISWRRAASSSGPSSSVGPLDDDVEGDVLPARPDVIDDDIPGQPEQPAPEGDAPRLIARQRLQGLDEDELRQVLRVARAADAGGDVAIDRPVEVVEQGPECFRVAVLAPLPRGARSPRRRPS